MLLLQRSWSLESKSFIASVLLDHRKCSCNPMCFLARQCCKITSAFSVFPPSFLLSHFPFSFCTSEKWAAPATFVSRGVVFSARINILLCSRLSSFWVFFPSLLASFWCIIWWTRELQGAEEFIWTFWPSFLLSSCYIGAAVSICVACV